MLPFHKRTARADDFEDLHTGDLVEVVGPVAAKSSRVPTSFPAPPSSRPQMFREPSSTDEVTCLMPAKGYGTLPPPPRSVRPNAIAPVQSFRPPQHQGFVHQQQLDGEQTRTDYRTLPPAHGSFPPPPRPPFGMSAMPQPIPQSMIPTIPPAPSSYAPVAYSMSPAKSDSDPRIDPPATVITTRTKVLTGRPTLSWGAALVAMGIFGGLVTAVLARGDGDALVDATASFVDPAHAAHANAAQAPAVETKLATATPMLQSPAPAPVAAPPAPAELGVIAPTATPAADPVAAKPAAASMAYSHPAQAAEKKAEPKVAEAPRAAPAPVAAKAAIKPWTPPARPAVAPPAEKAEKTTTAKADKKGNASKDDLASAKEAQKLADAQLEASLR